ncbi:hypothetical protein ACWGB8_32410 [Kitasatospora sp. NPDC054939]
MARLIVIIPLVLLIGFKLWTWYAERRTAQLQGAVGAARAGAAKRKGPDPVALGLPAESELDATRIRPDTPEEEAARTAALVGDWEPAAALLAAAGTDWNLRYRQVAVLAEWAAEDDAWLKAWRTARPGDADPAVVHADALVQVAWEIRSSKRAQYVTQEQFQGFRRVLVEAAAACEEAAALDPADPSPWVTQLAVSLGLGRSKEEFGTYWAEVVARAPHHYGAHSTALQYWCAKWYGSHEEMTAFAERAAASAPPGSLLTGLRLRAVAERELGEDTYRSWMTDEARAAADALLAELRDVPADDFRVPAQRHLLAAALTHNRRWAEAVEQFRLVGPYIDAVPWTYTGDPAGVFAEIRDRALTGWDKAGRPAA